MAGEPTVTVTRSIRNGSITVGGTVETITTAPYVPYYSETFGVVTDQEIDIGLTITKMKGVGIVADKACTLKTNSTSSPGNTFVLVANKPIIWASGDASANPVTVDITKFYLTTTVINTTLKMIFPQDISV